MISDPHYINQHQRQRLMKHLEMVLPAMGCPTYFDGEKHRTFYPMAWGVRFKGCQQLVIQVPQANSVIQMTVGQVGALHVCADDLYKRLTPSQFMLAVRRSATCAGDLEKYVRIRGTARAKDKALFLSKYFEVGEAGTHVWARGFKSTWTPEEWADRFSSQYEFKGHSEAIACLVNAMYKDEEKEVFYEWKNGMREEGKYCFSAYDHTNRCFVPLWKDGAPDNFLDFFVTEGDLKLVDFDLSTAKFIVEDLNDAIAIERMKEIEELEVSDD